MTGSGCGKHPGCFGPAGVLQPINSGQMSHSPGASGTSVPRSTLAPRRAARSKFQHDKRLMSLRETSATHLWRGFPVSGRADIIRLRSDRYNRDNWYTRDSLRSARCRIAYLANLLNAVAPQQEPESPGGFGKLQRAGCFWCFRLSSFGDLSPKAI